MQLNCFSDIPLRFFHSLPFAETAGASRAASEIPFIFRFFFDYDLNGIEFYYNSPVIFSGQISILNYAKIHIKLNIRTLCPRECVQQAVAQFVHPATHPRKPAYISGFAAKINSYLGITPSGLSQID
jgi:hypothetical protein